MSGHTYSRRCIGTVVPCYTRLPTVGRQMSESSGSTLSEAVPRLFAARQQLQQLFRRVDAMEAFVTTASGQLSRLEEQMDKAEGELAPPGSLTQTFSALFQVECGERMKGGARGGRNRDQCLLLTPGCFQEASGRVRWYTPLSIVFRQAAFRAPWEVLKSVVT